MVEEPKIQIQKLEVLHQELQVILLSTHLINMLVQQLLQTLVVVVEIPYTDKT